MIREREREREGERERKREREREEIFKHYSQNEKRRVKVCDQW